MTKRCLQSIALCAVFMTGLSLLLAALASGDTPAAYASVEPGALLAARQVVARDSAPPSLAVVTPSGARAETSFAAADIRGGTHGALPAAGMALLSAAQTSKTSQPDAASSKSKVIYLTFDDGPSRTFTPQVLALLARYQAHATFFIVGQNGRVDRDLLKAIQAGGNALGNHTYDHPFLADLSRAQVRGELQRTEKVLGANGGPCMRPPFGSVNRVTRSEAARLGLHLVMWDIDPRDWSRPGVKHISSFILNAAYPGAIILMHDGGPKRTQTVAALALVLQGLSGRGYHFATLPACR